MWYIHTVEHFSALDKKRILPFVTIWMNQEDIMLSEISQTEWANTWYHLYEDSKTVKLTEAESRTVVAGAKERQK